jgi:nicotinate-nucleotide adenylyltransferase
MTKVKKRIGIFAGTFDPVHSGHISFALEAIKKTDLDSVIFLPERRPRHKPEVEHFGHRTAMISRAIQPYHQLGLLELPDVHFDVARTLPKLHREFSGHQLVLLMGGEAAANLPSWPDAKKLVKTCELVIGLRAGQSKSNVLEQLNSISPALAHVTFIKSKEPHISSSRIRESLKHNRPALGLLTSVQNYARANWLYVSPSGE